MSFAIVGDRCRETENGLEVTIHMARGSHVEFASELGHFQEELDNQFLLSYLKRQYGDQPITKIRFLQQGRLIGTTTMMQILADVHSNEDK